MKPTREYSESRAAKRPRHVVVLPSFIRVAATKMRFVTLLVGSRRSGSAGRSAGLGRGMKSSGFRVAGSAFRRLRLQRGTRNSEPGTQLGLGGPVQQTAVD